MNSETLAPADARHVPVVPPERDIAGPSENRWQFFTEAFILRSVFWTLVAASVAFLAFDLHHIYQQAEAGLPGETSTREPVVQLPPRQRDQVRPYLPLSHPVHKKGSRPKMPGLLQPPGKDAVAARMSFVRGPDNKASAIGRIEQGTVGDLERFLKSQAGEIKAVYLHSPGGSVNDAIAMSKMLREEKINTVVPDDGYCASSCPIVFSGGVERRAGDKAWIGVHQIYSGSGERGTLDQGIAQAQFTTARIQETLTSNGVDAALWNKAMQTPSDRLYVFTREELTAFKLTKTK